MQAIGLVLGDEFLLQYNFSIDTTDVATYIKNLTWDWNTDEHNHMSDFDDYWQPRFSEILGPYGFCYSFNIVDAEELFNLEM
jgi:hypothetical protein